MKFKQLPMYAEYRPKFVSANADWFRNDYHFYWGDVTITFNKDVNTFSKKYLEVNMKKLRDPRIKTYYNIN